ncbi:MAG: CpsD/CapB family tyrosine-protein kinase [Coriobacteriales bacterium]|nr:CpsD/CapB family tyrosine-protein kinase [Coriobacteriales bacterium]
MAILGHNNQTQDERTIDNSAKTLLANIRFMSVDKPIRSIVITSSVPNEGKTFVAANLARAMATSGRKTIIVECDMRRRSMARELETHAQHGIYSVLAGEVSLGEAVVTTKIPNMHFLDSEPHIPNPSDLLNSSRFAKLLQLLKQEYAYIVIDTPPVGTFVDAAVIGAKADAVFMVVRERFTRRDEVARAADQLKTANVPLAGIVMNYCERQSSEYYYEYYYREGQGEKKNRGRNKSDWQEGAPVSDVADEGRSDFSAELTGEFPVQHVAQADEVFGGAANKANTDDSVEKPAESHEPRNWSNAPDERLINPDSTDDLIEAARRSRIAMKAAEVAARHET